MILTTLYSCLFQPKGGRTLSTTDSRQFPLVHHLNKQMLRAPL